MKARATLTHQLRFALPLWVVLTITDLLPENRVSVRLRGALCRPFIRRCGKDLQVARGVTLLSTDNLMVGDHVYLGRGSWINALGGVTLDDEVVCGPYVVISSLRHEFRNGSVRFGGSSAGKVHVGRGTWLAAHVSVSMGTTIGEGVIVGANSAVTHDLPSGVLVGGVPARVIGPRRDRVAALQSSVDFRSGQSDRP